MSSCIDEDEVPRRIEQLRNGENNRGFVYYGERQWLEERRLRSNEFRYSDWISECYSILFHARRWEDDIHAECYAHWKYYARDCEALWLPSEICGSVFGVHHFGMAVPGDNGCPSEDSLITSFEVLHDLAYHLATIVQRVDTAPVDDDEDIDLDWITIGVRPREWRCVVSNYQGPFDFVDFVGWDPVI